MKITPKLAKAVAGASALFVAHVFSAVGHIVGIRLMTEAFAPNVFGAGMLILGLSALIASAVSAPVLQATLYFYPILRSEGREEVARSTSKRLLGRNTLLISPAVGVAAGICVLSDLISAWQAALFGALTLTDIARAYCGALLNAEQKHTVNGFSMAAEAWARPATATIVSSTTGASVTTILASFFFVSFALTAFLLIKVGRADTKRTPPNSNISLSGAFDEYARPLLFNGVVGWTAGMADRYILGILASPADAGLYTAAHAMASKPIILVGAITESIFRPILQDAIANQDATTQRKTIAAWFALNISIGIAATAAMFLLSGYAARILLSPEYNLSADLLPWITLGYSILIAGHVLTRLSYAHANTKAVLITTIVGAVALLASCSVLIATFGLIGAALAVLCAHTAQTTVAFAYAKRHLFVVINHRSGTSN